MNSGRARGAGHGVHPCAVDADFSQAQKTTPSRVPQEGCR